MVNRRASNAEALGFSVEEVEHEFEVKLEQLDILGAKRDLLVGELLCEYRPSFIAIVEASDRYDGKLEKYYRERFQQDPSNVQRYMRVWEFWCNFAIKDGNMTVDDLAKYPNTTLDSARRLHDVRQDAVLVIDHEVHLSPALVTDGRGTHLRDFTRPELDRICKNLMRKQALDPVSLSDKGIIPDDNGPSIPLCTSVAEQEAGHGALNTRSAVASGNDSPVLSMPATSALNGPTVAESVMSSANTVTGPADMAVHEPDDTTASPLAQEPSYPRTIRGRDWPDSRGTVEFTEGDVATENSGVKFIYRAVNCRVQVCLAHEGAEPEIVVKPIDSKANGAVVVWQSGQYDDNAPVLTAYVYDAQLGLGKATRFEKTEK